VGFGEERRRELVRMVVVVVGVKLFGKWGFVVVEADLKWR
jgi:hypothetical protein